MSTFRIAIVADLDGNSRELGGKNGDHSEWVSYIQTAALRIEFDVPGSNPKVSFLSASLCRCTMLTIHSLKRKSLRTTGDH